MKRYHLYYDDKLGKWVLKKEGAKRATRRFSSKQFYAASPQEPVKQRIARARIEQLAILTEDGPSGAVIEGVRFENPFLVH